MSGGNSIGIGKSIVDLGNGVGISIRISLPLANVVGVQATVSSQSTVSSVSSVSSEVSLVSMDRGRVRSVGNISRVVGMSGGNSIGIGKSIVDLGNGVGISISLGLSLRVSLPFVNVTSISSKTVKSRISPVESSSKSIVSTISSNETPSQTIISSISCEVSRNSFPLANVVCVQAIVSNQSTITSSVSIVSS